MTEIELLKAENERLRTSLSSNSWRPISTVERGVEVMLYSIYSAHVFSRTVQENETLPPTLTHWQPLTHPTPPTSQNKALEDDFEDILHYALNHKDEPDLMDKAVRIRTALMGVSPQVEQVTVEEFNAVLDGRKSLADNRSAKYLTIAECLKERYPNGLRIIDE